jgi:integrase
MPVFITEKHLVAGTERKTYSDGGPKGQKGFALRTTPNGVFTFYFQHLNTATGKRDWHVIGAHPEWTPARARVEATRLAGLIAGGKSIKLTRQIATQQARAGGTSFQQAFDQYETYCTELVDRRWGRVPRKETFAKSIKYAFTRPLAWWANRPVSEITTADVKELYKSFVGEGKPAQANNVRGQLCTFFVWAMACDQPLVTVNPCTKMLEDDVAVEKGDTEDGRVLTADELRTFWFGLDRKACPGTRLARLALKLSLVTVLRTGECVKIERENVTPDSVTLPLAIVKGRRSRKARAVVQPLNSLAREILGEVFSIGDASRRWAFPGKEERDGEHMTQQGLGRLMARKTTDKGNQGEGICEYLKLDDVTPHDLRRTAACILEQLGYDDKTIGKVMTHKTADKEAAPVTRERYLVPVQIIARPVDVRIKALDDLDAALREILGLTKSAKKQLPSQQRLIAA